MKIIIQQYQNEAGENVLQIRKPNSEKSHKVKVDWSASGCVTVILVCNDNLGHSLSCQHQTDNHPQKSHLSKCPVGKFSPLCRERIFEDEVDDVLHRM